MSFDAEDQVARVLEEGPLPAIDSDSKWIAIHDGSDPSAPRITANPGRGSLFTVAWVLGIALGLVWVLRNGRTVFDQWQENVHRRANRRRHGIPDDDDRPFNVAYAAAALARRQREEQAKKRVENARCEASQQVSKRAGNRESTGLRQRTLQAESTSTLLGSAQHVFLQESPTNPLENQAAQFVPQENSSHHTQFRPQPSADSTRVQAQSYDWSNRRQAKYSEDHADQPLLSVRSSNLDRSNRTHLDLDDAEPVSAERRKHHELDETDDEDRLPKKSRVTADGDLDSHNDARWANMPGGSRRGSLHVLKRGSKRHANEEADEDWEMSQDKRARKGSLAHTVAVDDVDMVHDDLETDAEPTRGTKRDREDAESVADSGPYDADASISRPFRKRRASRRDDSIPRDLWSRGLKRDRTYEQSVSSHEDEDSDAPTTRHKRGRRLEERGDMEISPDGASESEAEISSDPACGGRRVGETWEVNGQSFKVGLDGRRLRHALIKKSRTKFPMPKDSAHRDARTNVDVIVEKWLNDDEYNTAKEQYELAWQDASPASTPDKTLVLARQEEPQPLSSGGKRLLWGGPPPSPAKSRSSVRSASGVQNPFDLAPSNAGRRVASAQLLLNNKIESPKLRNSKSFSKWEKQDLEASSLKKMRARMEKQKAETAAAAAKLSAPHPAPIPLASTTNTQAQAPLVPPNPDPPKPVPGLNTPTSAPPANPFVKPETRHSDASTSNISLGKPSNTPSSSSAQTSAGFMSVVPGNSNPSSAPAAQAVPKPSFSFSATPTSVSTASPALDQSTTQKPSFAFGIPGAVPSSSSTSNAPSATSKPALSFGPSSDATKGNVPKHAFGFGPGTGPLPSSELGKSGNANFFAKPVTQAPAVSGAATTSASASGSFNFNSGTQSPQANTLFKSNFPTGTTSGQSNVSPSSGGAGSLFGRLGATQDSSQTPQLNTGNSRLLSVGNGQTAPSLAAPFGKPNSTSGQPTSSSPFGQPQMQLPFSNPFGQNQEQGKQHSANKPTLFGTGTSSVSEPAKSNPFAAPSTTGGTPPAFSFTQPTGQTGPPTQTPASAFGFSAAQPGQQPIQSKPSFSFNFNGTTTPASSPQVAVANTGSPAANPFKPTPDPSTGPQAQPGGFSFSFGQSSAQPNQSPFSGFGTKPADSGKK